MVARLGSRGRAGIRIRAATHESRPRLSCSAFDASGLAAAAATSIAHGPALPMPARRTAPCWDIPRLTRLHLKFVPRGASFPRGWLRTSRSGSAVGRSGAVLRCRGGCHRSITTARQVVSSRRGCFLRGQAQRVGTSHAWANSSRLVLGGHSASPLHRAATTDRNDDRNRGPLGDRPSSPTACSKPEATETSLPGLAAPVPLGVFPLLVGVTRWRGMRSSAGAESPVTTNG